MYDLEIFMIMMPHTWNIICGKFASEKKSFVKVLGYTRKAVILECILPCTITQCKNASGAYSLE